MGKQRAEKLLLLPRDTPYPFPERQWTDSGEHGLHTLLESLAAARFFERLSSDVVSAVLQAATQRRYAANSIVIAQESLAERFFMVSTGQARYFYVTKDGRKLILTWLRAGEVFGTMALLPGNSSYLVSTETVRDSNFLVWEKHVIRDLAMQNPGLWENALAVASDYLTWYIATHVALVSLTARQRLASLLASLAEGLGRRVEHGIELDISNEELADAANVTHFTASRLLRQWHRDGILEKRRGRVLLRSPAALLCASQSSEPDCF